jgi:proteasome lid subunit RPN8/RPN11
MAMLLLPAHARADLERWVRAGYPDETCGLLVGVEQHGLRRVRRAVQARNLAVACARDRYELDPLDHLAADREARQQGLLLVGVWHSHPDHPATPSEVDRAAASEGWSYVILSVGAGGVRALRSWRLSGGGFQEEEVRTTSDPRVTPGEAAELVSERYGTTGRWST